MKVRDVIKRIEADGWVYIYTNGSHRNYKHPTKPDKVTVSGRLNVVMPAGTLAQVWKQAGLPKP